MSQKEPNPQISSDLSMLGLLSNGEQPYSLTLRRKGFDQDKEFIKFVRNVERLVRSSGEYKEWTDYVKDVLGYCNCAVTDEKSSEVTIEIHHHPITLFLIVKSIMITKINKEIEFCTFDIAQEAIELHFTNRLGYIPLVRTLHEKYHGGFLRIPMELVHGDWMYVFNNYNIEDIDMQLIGELASVKLEDVKTAWSRNNYPEAING